MTRYRSPMHKAAGLPQGRLIDVLEEHDEIVIVGVNPSTAQQVRADLEFVPLADGRLHVHARRGSLTATSGVQIRHKGGS